MLKCCLTNGPEVMVFMKFRVLTHRTPKLFVIFTKELKFLTMQTAEWVSLTLTQLLKQRIKGIHVPRVSSFTDWTFIRSFGFTELFETSFADAVSAGQKNRVLVEVTAHRAGQFPL